MPDRATPPLLLASGSPYRRALLERLHLPFIWASPEIDETARPGEGAEALVARLAEEKARALAPSHPGHLIIGSDQVALLDGRILGKPGSRERARAQLAAASGRRVRFLTGLCLLDTRSNRANTLVEPFDVQFRQLAPQQIERYLTLEEPFDCAGSFKSEGLGIALFSAMEGRDPNALVGLPLIALVDLLAQAGVAVI